MKKMEKIYDAQAKMTHEERKEQRKIERETNMLAKEIVNAKDMSAAEKMDAFTALKKQANDKIFEYFKKGGHEASQEVSALVDFAKDDKGNGTIKEVTPKSFSEIGVSSKDIEPLKEAVPEIFSMIDKSKLTNLAMIGRSSDANSLSQAGS